ncbi:MAG: SH3 domain-containing protein [Pseudomonadota bacterium]
MKWKVLGLLVTLVSVPAIAADLLAPITPAPPKPVVGFDPQACTLGRPIITWRAPNDRRNGQLPAGIQVEVIEPAWSQSVDLWVRLRSPRPTIYYGWVSTASLDCH